MRKFLVIIIALIGLIPSVKADTTFDITKDDYTPSSTFSGICNKSTKGYTYNNFENWIQNDSNKQKFDELYSNIEEMYNTSYQNYYYQTGVQIIYEERNTNSLYAIIIYRQISQEVDDFTNNLEGDVSRYLVSYYADGTYYKDYDLNGRNAILDLFDRENNEQNIGYNCSNVKQNYIFEFQDELKPFVTRGGYSYNPTFLFESNLPEEYKNKVRLGETYNIKDNNNNLLESYPENSLYPILYEEGYNPNSNVNLEEVNLNNYDYVLLNLKNYNRNEQFQTNLQVKGMIGITPIYNYGQTSKDAVTGVKVQDRCNVSYSNYTTYPLYVLKQDIQNNVVYAVKSCEENSSFKYDKNIFDITYVTAENREDPVITINGQQYHTIPFSNLPSTANKNEEENYIPGQSGSANDTGGLDGAVKGIQQKMSEIWNTFTYFTEFINQMFSVLPEELRIILVSAFTVMIVLGLIKIFIN